MEYTNILSLAAISMFFISIPAYSMENAQSGRSEIISSDDSYEFQLRPIAKGRSSEAITKTAIEKGKTERKQNTQNVLLQNNNEVKCIKKKNTWNCLK